ncbi:MAG: hypothetical protein HC896_07195 [Bacteroidales bacterium]|nr:hypothetical protein [Bacteroidales bacterium]
MNNEQSKHYKMFLSVQMHLDANTPVWSRVNRLVACKNDLDELIGRMEEKDEETLKGLSLSKNKQSLKKSIALKTSILSGQLQAYAEEQNLTDLLAKAKMSRTQLEATKDADLSPTVKSVANLATRYLNELADYGTSEGLITETLTSLEDFKALIGQPRNIINNKYVSINALAGLIDECTNVLTKRMDKMMLQFVETDPEFYQGYERSRVIVG